MKILRVFCSIAVLMTSAYAYAADTKVAGVDQGQMSTENVVELVCNQLSGIKFRDVTYDYSQEGNHVDSKYERRHFMYNETTGAYIIEAIQYSDLQRRVPLLYHVNRWNGNEQTNYVTGTVPVAKGNSVPDATSLNGVGTATIGGQARNNEVYLLACKDLFGQENLADIIPRMMGEARMTEKGGQYIIKFGTFMSITVDKSSLLVNSLELYGEMGAGLQTIRTIEMSDYKKIGPLMVPSILTVNTFGARGTDAKVTDKAVILSSDDFRSGIDNTATINDFQLPLGTLVQDNVKNTTYHVTQFNEKDIDAIKAHLESLLEQAGEARRGKQ